MALNKWATRIALTLSAPIIFVASCLEVAAMLSSDQVAKLEGYEIADRFYLVLGYPLTRLIKIFAPNGLQDRYNWWAVPLLTLLFACQWIIWAQLLVLVGRTAEALWRSLVGPSEPLETVWPIDVVKADGRRYKRRRSRSYPAADRRFQFPSQRRQP